LADLWVFAQELDCAQSVDWPVPPGFCGALVGPIAVRIAEASCGAVAPGAPHTATAEPESAATIAIAKIKRAILIFRFAAIVSE